MGVRKIGMQVGGVNFTPRPGGQTDFWNDRRNRMIFLEGGWASGKTYVGAHKFLDVHLFNAFDERGNPTGVKGAIVGPTDTAQMDYQVPAIIAAAKNFGLTVEYRAQISSTSGPMKKVLIFPELSYEGVPSLIMVRSAERPELITGWEVGHLWADEPSRWKEDLVNPVNDPFLQATGRVRGPKNRTEVLLFTYTNEGDTTRVYREAHSGKPGHAVYRAKTKDNLEAVGEFYNAQLGNLSPELADQYLGGGAMKLSGSKVYPTFEPSQNISDSVTLDMARPVALCFDFNIAPGMTVEIGQYIEHRDCFLFSEEIFDRGLDLYAALDRLERMVRSGSLAGVREFNVYGDASGNARWSGTGETNYQLIRMKLDRLQIPYRICVPGENPPVVDRVNSFNSALLDVYGKRHCLIHPRCTRLIEDLEKMKRNKKGEIDKTNPELSHASDAGGYWVYHVRPCRVHLGDTIGGRFAFGGQR